MRQTHKPNWQIVPASDHPLESSKAVSSYEPDTYLHLGYATNSPPISIFSKNLFLNIAILTFY